MSSSRPAGITAIAALLAIGAVGRIVSIVAAPWFLPIGAFLIALCVFMAVGLLRGRNYARLTLAVFLVLVLALSAMNLLAILLMPEVADLIAPEKQSLILLTYLVRMLVLPVILVYLFRPKVKEFFLDQSPDSDSALVD